MSERIRGVVNMVLVEHRGKTLTPRTLALIESQLVVEIAKITTKKKKKKKAKAKEDVQKPKKKKKKGRTCVVAVPQTDGSVKAQQTKGQKLGRHPYGDEGSVVAHPEAEI